MSDIITLDFETFFRSAKNKGTIGPKLSLKHFTYEQYIRDPEFKVHGVGIKVNRENTVYYPEKDVKDILHSIFTPGNTHTMIAHNTMFDGAVLSWYYGLRAERYWDTQGMSRAIWAQCSASLDQLAARLFPDDKTKRKGKELHSVDGLKNLTDEQNKILGGYCVQDVDLTFDCFAQMYPYFPNDELEIIDITLQMFIHPAFVLHRQTIIDYMESLHARRAELVKAAGVPKTTLSSNKQFSEYLKRVHNIDTPMKESDSNPGEMTMALAKDDLAFLSLQAQHPELKHIWDARTAVMSNSEITRGERLLDHAQVSHINPNGLIAVPLSYCGAHTKRFSGTNKVNFQNFKRGSPIRHAMYAPADHKVLVRDLSNIEGRMNAWFHEQKDKLIKYADNVDIYNELATTIYGYPVDRKALKKNDAGQYLDKKGNVTDDKEKAAKVFAVEGMVGKVAELGLGYQMGALTFLRQLLLAGVTSADESFAQKTVKTWRLLNSKIEKGWKRCESVIFDMARKDLEPYQWKCITVEKERLRLPSGLYLTYPGLVRKDNGHEQWFEYWEGDFMKTLYGGLLDENCLAAGTKVLTDSGWKNIEDITTNDLVHDGDSWVSHEGLIRKGEQSCIDFLGVLLTPDHEVLNEKHEWEAASQNPKPFKPNLRAINNNGNKQIDTLLQVPTQPVFDIRNAGPQHRFVINSDVGPIIVHNCIQAISRVVMTTMMLNISRRIKQYGARVVLTVHDEIVVIAPNEHVETVDQIMAEEMSRCPDWCNDGELTLTSEGGYAQNYSK